jgi:isochorismate synthase
VASSTTPAESRALDLRAPLPGSVPVAEPEASEPDASLISPVLEGVHEPLPADATEEGIWERLAKPGPAFVYVTPDGDILAAFGSAARFEASGPGRFRAARQWLDGLQSAARGSTEAVPIAVGGFSFAEGSAGSPAGFGDSVFFVPAEIWCLGERPGRYAWSRTDTAGDPSPSNALLGGPSVPQWTEAEWDAGVREVLRRIDRGELQKAVLARAVVVEPPAPADAVAVFRSLARENPECFRFFVRPSGRASFVGASPERLVSCRNDRVVSDAVAGTASDGALLTSTKDRSEHDFVVRHILEALAPLTTSIGADAEPSLQRHRRLTHLRTRIAGVPKPGAHILDLVERVHPTPAVAGSPAEAAVALIRSLEPSHRGWYAGAVGWMSAAGSGDFAVGIRSALLYGPRAVLFAGAGIVPGSDPAAEWAETEVKLSVMREAIADAGR